MTDLSGHWSGSYTYPDSFEPVPFEAEIREVGGRISGTIVEPLEPFAGGGDAHSLINGERRGAHVGFTKIYDQIEAYPNPVAYEGIVDSDECEIAGTWTISGEWSGAFVMTRPKSARDEQESEAEAEATV